MRKINLGSGDSKKGDGFINIDVSPRCKPDIVRDITRGLPFDDQSVDEVYSRNCLEHLMPWDLVFVMQEIQRVLKKGGRAELIVPIGIVPDWTHQSYFHKYTFENMFSQQYNYGVTFNILEKNFTTIGPPHDYEEMRLLLERT